MAEAEKRAVVLDEPRFKLAEFERNVWVANAAEGTKVSDVLTQEFWSYVAEKLRPYDHVEVRVDTGEWLLQLLVVESDRRWAKVVVLHKYDLELAEEHAPPRDHDIVFKGPQLKWCVIRKADKEILFKGLSKQGAQEQLERHEEVVA